MKDQSDCYACKDRAFCKKLLSEITLRIFVATMAVVLAAMFVVACLYCRMFLFELDKYSDIRDKTAAILQSVIDTQQAEARQKAAAEKEKAAPTPNQGLSWEPLGVLRPAGRALYDKDASCREAGSPNGTSGLSARQGAALTTRAL